MRHFKYHSILTGFLVSFALSLSSSVFAADEVYSVQDLLRPCIDGDNDSRGGQVDELECEQYINGVVDAVSLTLNLQQRGICLPTVNKRPDDIRRAFVKWVYDNHEQRSEPAAKGVLRSLKGAFPCKK